MQQPAKFLSKIAFPAVLLAVSLFLAIQNYTPGTWLTGWDNLHSEFNFGLNIGRSLSAVWQEYQGLGLLGGMGHAADLTRQILLLIASLILPANFLRYLWTFLMLAIGPLGAYFLAKFLISDEDNFIVKLSSFMAGIFYLLNLATIQYFYIPYESFISFYGFIPWLLYFAIKFLKEGGRKNLFVFFLISVLATPSFYVQTMFLVFVLTLIPFVVDILVEKKMSGIVKSVKLFAVILFSNAFWLLPTLYFSLTGAGVVAESKINSFATPETQLMNAGYGKPGNIVQLKGFWFNYMDLGGEGKFDYLLSSWRDYLSVATPTYSGYLLFGFAVLGISLAITRKSFRWKFALPLVFLLSYFMLASSNPPFGGLFSLLSRLIPFFENFFRSPFTKWSGISALTYALGIGLFVHYLSSRLSRIKKIIVAIIVSTLTLLAILAVTIPVFKGNLVKANTRIKIPNVYFELFSYLKTQPNEARIALLPAQTFWGWNFYDWGYRGSGFLWYGVEQPILDRAFDVWSRRNETFYNEFSSAIYGNDAEYMAGVIDKYDITYVLMDKSIILPGETSESLKLASAGNLLLASGGEVVWEKDNLSLFKFKSREGFIRTPKNYSYVTSGNKIARVDSIFNSNGTYVSPAADTPSIIYPFSRLTQEKIDSVAFDEDGPGVAKVTISGEDFVSGRSKLHIPPVSKGTEYRVPAEISYRENKVKVTFDDYANIIIDGEETTVAGIPSLFVLTPKTYPKVLVGLGEEVYEISQGASLSVPRVRLTVGDPIRLFVYDSQNEQKINTSTAFGSAEVKKCWTREKQEGSIEEYGDGKVRSFRSKDAVGCIDFKLGTFRGKSLMGISLPFRSPNGARPHFCLVEEDKPGTCLHEEIFYNSLTSYDWTQVSRQVVLPTDNNYWLNVSARPPEARGESWDIDYTAPQISIFPLLASFTYQEEIWRELTSGREIALQEGRHSVALSVSVPEEKIDFAGFGRFKVDNCDILDRGDVGKEVEEGTLIYSSVNLGSACDFVILDKVSTKNAYILRFRGKGILGRGLKFYLFNSTTKHADIEALLPHGNFDERFIVLPKRGLDESNYSLNLENRSFGGELSKNEINGVNIYGLPVDWINDWKIVPENFSVSQNHVQVITKNKRATFFYSVELEGQSEGLLELSQSYNSGWVAFAMTNDKWPISNLKGLEHVKVNSWANGWIVKNSKTQKLQNSKIYVIYWPQFLEFLGFALLAVGLGFVALAKIEGLTHSTKHRVMVSEVEPLTNKSEGNTIRV